MIRRIFSDLRRLLPFALAGALLMNIVLEYTDTLGRDGSSVLALGAVGLLGLWAAADLFGREFSYHRLGWLMAQPITRRRIWFEKSAAMLLFNLSLVLAAFIFPMIFEVARYQLIGKRDTAQAPSVQLNIMTIRIWIGSPKTKDEAIAEQHRLEKLGLDPLILRKQWDQSYFEQHRLEKLGHDPLIPRKQGGQSYLLLYGDFKLNDDALKERDRLNALGISDAKLFIDDLWQVSLAPNHCWQVQPGEGAFAPGSVESEMPGGPTIGGFTGNALIFTADWLKKFERLRWAPSIERTSYASWEDNDSRLMLRIFEADVLGYIFAAAGLFIMWTGLCFGALWLSIALKKSHTAFWAAAVFPVFVSVLWSFVAPLIFFNKIQSNQIFILIICPLLLWGLISLLMSFIHFRRLEV